MHVLSHKHGPLQSPCLAAVDKATKSAVHMVSGRHCFQSHVQSDCHKERFARKTLKPKQLRNHRNLRFTRNVQGQTHFMGCCRTVIPRTSTDKAGYQCLIYMPPRTSTDKVFSSFSSFSIPTDNGPRTSTISLRIPRPTTDNGIFCQNSQTFCESQATGPSDPKQNPRRIQHSAFSSVRRIHAGSFLGLRLPGRGVSRTGRVGFSHRRRNGENSFADPAPHPPGLFGPLSLDLLP